MSRSSRALASFASGPPPRLPPRAAALLALLLLTLLTLVAAPASAQMLEGRVVDARTEEPVRVAYVALIAEGEGAVLGVTGDWDGSFSLQPPAPGSYFVYVRALGYRPVVDGLFELGDGGSMEVEVRLRPAPIRLDALPVSVNATDRYLRTVGFYRRREWGVGHHLTHEEIRRRSTVTVVDVLREIPRVFVATEGLAERLLRAYEGPYPDIVVREGGHFCPPHIYVDGMLVHRGGVEHRRPEPDGPAMPDEWVTPDQIAAMELYRSRREVPPRYNLPNTCGVLLIWTWH